MFECEAHATPCFRVAIAAPIDKLFDYLPPSDCNLAAIKPGVRVLVPFGKTEKVGFLVEISPHSHVNTTKLKQIQAILDTDPLLSAIDLTLLKWTSQYYHHPLGEVLATAFPVALRQGKPAVLEREQKYRLSDTGLTLSLEQLKHAPRQQALLALFQARGSIISKTELKEHSAALKIALEKNWLIEDTSLLLPIVSQQIRGLQANPQQQHAIQTVTDSLDKFAVFLLEGVTGSGKTEVYMQIISHVLAQGKQVLVLLPEITLTPQLEQRFRRRFTVPVVTFHSKLTDTQRLNAWLNMQQGSACILLGTRSALFTPLSNPGVIFLDEEHDSSFKQQEGFRFSARDIAIARGKSLNIPVVLGSATPSLESLYNVERQRYQLLSLPVRAGNAVSPEFHLLDIRNKKLQEGLSEQLLAAIRHTLAQHQQVLLFLNRRGYAPVQICHSCGWVSRCQRCEANMVIHAQDAKLRCHHCGDEHPLLHTCPACKTGNLVALGMGTERIEQTLNRLFADKCIVRLDKDSTQRKGSLETYLQQINAGDVDIILGTQMLAKGHHFPNVTLAAILDIDSGLFSIDYRAAERLAQLVVQVAGRAGRADKPGRVILQTRQPQHPLLLTLINGGYQAFAKAALQERKQAQLPPYSYQALFRAHANNQTLPQQFLQLLRQIINRHNVAGITVFGPVAAPMMKRAGQYRFQLLLQSNHRQELHKLLDKVLSEISLLKEAKAVRWTLDIDPIDLY